MAYWNPDFWSEDYWSVGFWGTESGVAPTYTHEVDVALIGNPADTTQSWEVTYSSAGGAVFTIAGGSAQVYTAPSDVFTQTGDVVVTLSPNATQTVVQVGYSQTGGVSFTAIPAGVQTFGSIQLGSLVVTLAATSGQIYEPPPPVATHVQDSNVQILYSVPAFQFHTDPYFGPSDEDTNSNVDGFPGATTFTLNVFPELNTEIYFELTVSCYDTKWLSNSGTSGQGVGINVSYKGVSFGSVEVSRQRLVIGPYSGDMYAALRAELQTGETEFDLSGYEDFGTYTLSQNLGSTTLRIRAFTSDSEAYLFGTA